MNKIALLNSTSQQARDTLLTHCPARIVKTTQEMIKEAIVWATIKDDENSVKPIYKSYGYTFASRSGNGWT